MSSFSGYIHATSPKKKSRKRTSMSYFDFKVQTDAGYKRAVCFDPSFHDAIKTYQTSQTPVTISNATEKLNSFNNMSEIIVNKRAKVQPTSNHQVNFEYQPPPSLHEESTKVKIDHLQTLEQGQSVIVSGRLYLNKESTEQKEVNGQDLKFNPKALLQDETSSIPITIWGEFNDILENNKCYEFTNLKYKVFQHKRSLSTTPSTTYKEIASDLPNIEDQTVQEHFNDIHVEALSIMAVEKFKRWSVCKRCKKALTDVINHPVVTCAECKAVQRPSTCESNASIRILFELKDDKSIWLTAFKEIIIQILDSSNLMTEKHVTLLSEDDDLHLAFLMLPGPMQIFYSASTEIMSSIDIQYELP